MKADGLMIGFAVLLVVLAGIAGWTLRGCGQPKPAGPVTVTVPDSLGKARVYAEGFADGRASIRPVVKYIPYGTTGRAVEYVHDSASAAMAEEAYRKVDSVMAENKQLQDVIGTATIEDPRFRASLVYRIRERSFRGTEISLLESGEMTSTPNGGEDRSFWQRWGYGPQLGIGLGAYPEASGASTTMRYRPGAYIGFGIHYDLK